MRRDMAATAAGDVAGHKLSVLMEDGLYRHLLFKAPTRSEYWFEIMTAPGTLTVRGDMGTYVFARETDMVPFFLGSANGDKPNTDYWAEKCVSHDGRRGVKEYSEQVLRARIEEAVRGHMEYADMAQGTERLDFRVEVREHLEGIDLGDQRDAQRELMGFVHKTGNPFEDAYEWDPTEYTFSFQWTVHTLLIALQAYREQQRRDAALCGVLPAAFDQTDLLRLHRGLVRDAGTQPEYRDRLVLAGYSEGVEHAIDSLWLKGYRDVSKLRDAWVIAGPDPAFHERAKQTLSRDWRTLHAAVTTILKTITTKEPTK